MRQAHSSRGTTSGLGHGQVPAEQAAPARTPPAVASDTAQRWEGAPTIVHGSHTRVLNVPPDVYDLRDRVYSPSLCVPPDEQVPSRVPELPPVLDQVGEGACTGFALATVLNHLLRRRRRARSVSPRFLYENARRYDEWEGQDYEGSSIRGAMKGLLAHGACQDSVLPYVPGQALDRLPQAAYDDAELTPLGAYYRVTTSSINDLQIALVETGAVLVSAQIHDGWQRPVRTEGDRLPVIEWQPGEPTIGGHAFALIGYTSDGFIVQNSWGDSWGAEGLAVLTYADWLANRMDAWVAQLGVGRVSDQLPLSRAGNGAVTVRVERVNNAEIQGHYLSINNGSLDTHGHHPSYASDIADIVNRITSAAAQQPVKLLLFAHGGLVGEDGAAQKTAEFVRRFTPKGVYPLHFIWHTDFLQEIEDLISGKRAALQEPVGGFLGGLTEKLQDALDGGLEVAARPLGKPIWTEMKRDAQSACAVSAAGPAARLLDALHQAGARVQYHLVGHSAGSIFHCRLLDWFTARQVEIESLTFWAPAVSTTLFCDRAKPLIGNLVHRFSLHTMADRDERDDHCGNIGQAGVYHKSLLYLVSYACEDDATSRLLGLDRHIRQDRTGRTDDVDPQLKGWVTDPKNCELVFRRPNLERPGATLHGSFDDDEPTIQELEAHILGT